MIYNQLILLFGLMGIGYLVNKFGILDKIANQKLSSLLVNLAIPSTIINASVNQTIEDLSSVIQVFLIAMIYYLVTPLLSRLCAKWLHTERTIELMLTYSNLGFMGIPIVTAVYGTEYVFYVSIFMMIFNISIFSHGVYILKEKHEKKTDLPNLLKDILNPGIVSALIAICIFFFQIPLHNNLKMILESLSSITTPLAMLVIGSTLAAVPLKEIFIDKKMYLFSILKLLIYPFILLIILLFLLDDKSILGIVVILVSLPTAGNVSMICSEYNGNIALVSKGICISTILSVTTIPIWIFLCRIL